MEENPNKSTNQEEIACSNCGAKLTFAPGTDSLKCEFCGTINEIEIDREKIKEAHQEIDFYAFLNQQSDIFYTYYASMGYNKAKPLCLYATLLSLQIC